MKLLKKKKELYDDSWLYILILITLVILSQSLKNYGFTISGISLSYGIFILPFLFFIPNYILKKYGYERSIVAISGSGLSLVLFFLIINFSVGKEINMLDICGDFLGYVGAQFVGLTIYNFLFKNTNCSYILLFFMYLFDLIVFYLIYTLFNMNLLLTDSYWNGYFLTLVLQSILCVAITYLDKKTIPGL